MLATAAIKQSGRRSMVQVRAMHDLTFRNKTGQPMIKQGLGGRSTTNGHIATVFGCTGFLGRYVVAKLAKQGTQVVVANRDPDEARPLKVTGDLGQIIPLEFDLRNEEQIRECVRHSDIVINCIGRDYETKNFTYDDVHVKGSRALAEIAADAGVSRFIQVSALNASEDSPSKFLQTKAKGEKAVKEVFPEATIVRPAIMWGHEDRFLNRIANTSGDSFQFWVNNSQTKILPVSVVDVAHAIEVMFGAESTAGKTYELYGDRAYTFEQVFDLAREISMKPLPTYNIPTGVAKLIASGIEKLPYNHTISADLIERMRLDEQPSGDAHTFKDLYIEPTSLEADAIHYLRRFRSNAVFDLPYEKGEGIVKKGVYHVID
ncbi:NAD(P)-binding protein [Hesseltinella vesiculosa]|uniref:NAD(P)-binding protein n=1 Tax=Hesseltinella vesiculosa TaxID=101127 RepID=A0A1X2G557_9FUNG|nr:NAD(P)-binding protein [Hesseltinella vesiculosa]